MEPDEIVQLIALEEWRDREWLGDPEDEDLEKSFAVGSDSACTLLR